MFLDSMGLCCKLVGGPGLPQMAGHLKAGVSGHFFFNVEHKWVPPPSFPMEFYTKWAPCGLSKPKWFPNCDWPKGTHLGHLEGL